MLSRQSRSSELLQMKEILGAGQASYPAHHLDPPYVEASAAQQLRLRAKGARDVQGARKKGLSVPQPHAQAVQSQLIWFDTYFSQLGTKLKW
jgi:hypothetical protein